jgi:hypothetical protein
LAPISRLVSRAVQMRCSSFSAAFGSRLASAQSSSTECAWRPCRDRLQTSSSAASRTPSATSAHLDVAVALRHTLLPLSHEYHHVDHVYPGVLGFRLRAQGTPRPDCACDEPDRTQHVRRSRTPVPGGYNEMPAVHAKDAGRARGAGHDAGTPRSSGRGAGGLLCGLLDNTHMSILFAVSSSNRLLVRVRPIPHCASVCTAARVKPKPLSSPSRCGQAGALGLVRSLSRRSASKLRATR